VRSCGGVVLGREQRQEFIVGGGSDKGRSSTVLVEYRYEAKRGTGTQRDPDAHFYVKVASAREYARVVLHQHHHVSVDDQDATLDVSLDGLRRRYIVNAVEDRIFVHSPAFPGEIGLTLKSRYASSPVCGAVSHPHSPAPPHTTTRYAQAFVGDAAGEGEYIAQMPGTYLFE
jgi:hypothetical protein